MFGLFNRFSSRLSSPGVRLFRACLIFVSFSSLAAQAAETEYFRFSDLLKSDELRSTLRAPVTLYWGNQTAPAFIEKSQIATYTRSGISLSPFGGSRKHCIESFEKTLDAIVKAAEDRGFDSVTSIHALTDNTPANDYEGFYCKPGYKTTEVKLSVVFGLTAEGKSRVLARERASFNQPARAPAKDAIYLSLASVIESPEARAILGPDLQAFVGPDAPDYRFRFGPETYSENGDIKALGIEGACKRAVLKALGNMVGDARKGRYDAITKIRSYWDEHYTPSATDFECHIDGNDAEVTLRATFITRMQ